MTRSSIRALIGDIVRSDYRYKTCAVRSLIAVYILPKKTDLPYTRNLENKQHRNTTRVAVIDKPAKPLTILSCVNFAPTHLSLLSSTEKESIVSLRRFKQVSEIDMHQASQRRLPISPTATISATSLPEPHPR